MLEAGNLPKITKDELNELQKTTLEMKDVQLLLGPHPTLEDMHDFIITRWNLRVHDIDEVIIIGDIFIGERKTVDKANDMLNRLKGNKYLIPGNHDNIEFLKGISRVRQKDGILPTFEVLPHLVEKRFPLETKNSKHYSLVCSHYPLASWSTVAKGIGHVHGHCHQAYRGRILDVGWDSIYTGGPGIWSVAEIKEYMDSQEIFSVDYH